MGAAVVVQERAERPGWVERFLVVGVCAAMLVTLGILDQRAASREKARAYAVIAERAKHAAERSSREAMTAPSASSSVRTDSVGRDAPITVAAGPGLGTAAPQNILHRVQGPRTPDARSAIPEPASPTRPARATVPAPAPATTVTASAHRGEESLLLGLMAALGLSMAGGGLRLLSRRSA